MKKALLLFIIPFICLSAFCQDQSPMLLNDVVVQIEATDAVNDMYNFKFEKAELYFTKLQNQYPEHPMPYFLMALSNWWKMMPAIENEDFTNVYEKEFISYLDQSIDKGEKLFKVNDDNLEAAFFLCAAHGFKGRFYADNKNYVKAAFEGKSALHYLTYTKGKGNLSSEFLFGESLFNYYAEWIKDEYPLLRPLVGLFPKGNKIEGIAQLKECAYNAFYTRIEAQYFLMRIYNVEESKPMEAYPYAKYLAENFPDNPYFQRIYASLCWQLRKHAECEKVSYDINYKVNIGMTGYEEHTGRLASFFLGRILYDKGDYAKSKFYLLKASAFAETANLTKMYYSLSSYFYLGLIERKANNNSEAEAYFLKVIKLADDKQESSITSIYADAAYQLGDLYEQLKLYPRAESYYKHAIIRAEKIESERDFTDKKRIENNSKAGLERLKLIKK